MSTRSETCDWYLGYLNIRSYCSWCHSHIIPCFNFLVTMAENACSHRYNMDKGRSGEMAFSAKLGYSPTIPIPCQKMASDTSLHKSNCWINRHINKFVMFYCYEVQFFSLVSQLEGWYNPVKIQERDRKYLSTISLSCSKLFSIDLWELQAHYQLLAEEEKVYHIISSEQLTSTKSALGKRFILLAYAKMISE